MKTTSVIFIFILALLGLTAPAYAAGDIPSNPPCPSCNGTDRCSLCQGKGIAYGVTCSLCEGTGRCKLCAMMRESRIPPSAGSSPAVPPLRPSAPPSPPAQPAPCQYCHGTGKSPTDNLSASIATFGLDDQGTTFCSICNRTVSKPHLHGPCPFCYGTGKAR